MTEDKVEKKMTKAEAFEEYGKAREPAMEKYKKGCDRARAEFDEVTDSMYAEYKKRCEEADE